jgi:hypothetical protein
VRADLFDVHGRLVARLFDGASVASGIQRVPRRFNDARGDRPPSGVYFLRVTTPHEGTVTRAVTVLR